MLIFDELKENDPQLRLVAVVLAAGLGILLAGLWWVQIVSAREYQSHLETQSYRTVRIPAARGKIVDRHSRVLAENRPRYDLSLFLDDLSGQFQNEYGRLRPVKIVTNSPPFWEFGLGSTSVVTQRVRLKQSQIDALTRQAHCNVASAVVRQLGRQLGQPLTFDAADFERNYEKQLAMPYIVLKNLNEAQMARFEENYSGGLGADLELQSVRTYPLGTTAAHLLGYVQRDNSSAEGEDAFFWYRLPDYRGGVGIESGFDPLLRGHAGAEAVLVNNLGFRQTVNVWSQPEPGRNVMLTIDLDIQQAAERSLIQHQGTDARAAVVVMDVRTGDVLAMVSSPAFDPNDFAQGSFPPGEAARLSDPQLRPQINRATQENYAPGSIFKPIVGLAALETGLNPDAVVDNPGYIYVGKRHITDLAPPDKYNFRRAIIYSSNTYFITVGLQAGIDNVVRMAEKFHFGERTGLPTRQETPGIFPTLIQVHSDDWHEGDSANIDFGQGQMAVTPMQMAVAYAAIANGGTVLWPRLVEKIEDPVSGETLTNYPSGLVRDHLGVSARSLNILHDAMLAETEDPEGTGRPAVVPGLRICGKTGTAEIMDTHNRKIGRTTWFASFAPYEHPRYAVVVMVENGTFGGPTCAPIAHDIYETILKSETSNAPALTAARSGERMN